METVLETVDVPLEVAYLVHAPQPVNDRTILILAMHGFGQAPEGMLRLTIPAVGENTIVASIRAPNQQYLGPFPKIDGIGYNWGTREHSELNIRLHHDIVLRVSEKLRRDLEIPVERTVLMGFSQPCGLNYRFIGTHPDKAGGVIAICGGVPKDWEESKYARVAVPILHISRSEDEFFPEEVALKFPDRLRAHADNVEFHMIPGAHRFPSKSGSIIQAWIENKVRGKKSGH